MDDATQAIAVAVLYRAHQDVMTGHRKLREDALEFLTTPSADLYFWCTVAQLKPEDVIARYRR